MKAKHSLKVRLIRPRIDQPYWLLKIYPKGQGYGNNGLTLAKTKFTGYKTPGWIHYLYRILKQYNSDVSIQEIKKEIGKSMRRCFGKSKLGIEELHKVKPSKRAKVIGYL